MTRNLYALLVGINEYDKRSRIPALRGCVNDIQGMQAYLEGRVEGREFNLHLRVLANEQATRANIIEGFRAHLAQAGPEDVALFYYAGHGAQADAPEAFWPIDPDRMLETLVCYDSRIDDEHWDLADKELAKLIAEVDGKQPHIVVVLDCCHSGSGTRGEATRKAEPDRRPRPIESFIVSPADAQVLTSGTRSLTPSAMKLPVGRHVVLSACRDIEEASEYQGAGQTRGAFSYFFQESLAKANGALSYRDLFKRTNALVRLNIPTQAPQMESTHSEDLEQSFLGGAIAPTLPYFTASHHREHGWCIDGGAIHGLQPPAESTTETETTVLALFPFNSTAEQMREVSNALAQVKVTQVLPQLSKIEDSHSALADTANTFKAVVISSPLPPLAVFLEGDTTGIEALRQAIATAGSTAGPTAQPSLYVRAAEQASGASYRVLVKDNAYTITSPIDNRPLVTPVQGYTPVSVAKVVQNLEHMARWKTIAELDSPVSSQIQGAVKISIYSGESASHEGAPEITDPQIRLTYHLDSATQTWSPPRFRVKLHNTSNKTLYCALFYLTERFKADVLKPDGVGGIVRLLPDDELWFAGGRALSGTVADALWQQGITECRDILKLIACTDEFDPTLMVLGELGTPPLVRSATRSASLGGSLNRLMQRVTTRDIGFSDHTTTYDDWVASQIAFTFVRPQLSTPIDRSAPIAVGAHVTIAPHAALAANVRLTTVSQSTRDLGNCVLPSLLQEDALSVRTEPFQFTQSRSSDPGLSALELSNVSHFEAVTPEQPLVIESDITLDEGEYLLPIAYDGEFYLPLGYGKLKEGKTQIVIERLTEPVSEGRRSIQGSIRIFFQKVITKNLGDNLSQKIGITFEYPLLAAAQMESLALEGDLNNPNSKSGAKSKVVYVRDAEAVKAKVAQATNIALYVHGIFGDTESMLPSLETAIAAIEDESRPIGQLYDLVLAFDYENLNTTIDQNARLLKQRLESIGLGANHGKTLHIIAHSMGGLVSRWLIEQEGGHEMVSHLIMLGTPNAGSPWPQVQAGITAAVSFALNGLSTVVAPLKILEGFLKRVEAVDVSLDQMQPGSDFLREIAQAKDPRIPYTLVVGNTSLMPENKAADLKQRIMHKLGKVVEIPFFHQPNDIAVLVESITAVPAERSPAPKQLPTACNHLEYFTHPAGLASLSAAVVGTGIRTVSGLNRQTGLTESGAVRETERETAGTVEPAEAAESEPEGAAGLPEIARSPVSTPPSTPPAEKVSDAVVPSNRSVVTPLVLALVATALAGLGIFAWVQSRDATSPPPSPEPIVTPDS